MAEILNMGKPCERSVYRVNLSQTEAHHCQPPKVAHPLGRAEHRTMRKTISDDQPFCYFAMIKFLKENESLALPQISNGGVESAIGKL